MLCCRLIPKSKSHLLTKMPEVILKFLEALSAFMHGYKTQSSYLAETRNFEAFIRSQIVQGLDDILQAKALSERSQDELIHLAILIFVELMVVAYANPNPAVDNVRHHPTKMPRFSSLICIGSV